MTTSTPLPEPELRAFAAAAAEQQRCADCAVLWRPGWESLSGADKTSHLQQVGALGTPETRELLDEYHPQGTNQWSPDADRKSTRLNSSHSQISYAVFCL